MSAIFKQMVKVLLVQDPDERMSTLKDLLRKISEDNLLELFYEPPQGMHEMLLEAIKEREILIPTPLLIAHRVIDACAKRLGQLDPAPPEGLAISVNPVIFRAVVPEWGDAFLPLPAGVIPQHWQKDFKGKLYADGDQKRLLGGVYASPMVPPSKVLIRVKMSHYDNILF